MKTAIGQDSHRFSDDENKPLLLASVKFDDAPALSGNSDADVVLHALTNAVSGISGVNILGAVADQLCRQGITDSRVYLQKALDSLHPIRGTAYKITHVSICMECQRPKISAKIPLMRQKIAKLLNITQHDVGITATTGEGLTAFGRGEGIQVFVQVTAMPEIE